MEVEVESLTFYCQSHMCMYLFELSVDTSNHGTYLLLVTDTVP